MHESEITKFLQEVITDEEAAVQKIHALMVKLQTTLLRAKFYEHANLPFKTVSPH